MTIVGTRPELIKLSRVMAHFDQVFDHRWIHTGQNWSPNLRDVFLQEMEIRPPDAQGSVSARGPTEAVSQMLQFVDDKIAKWSPDAVVVLGDTNSALTVYSARRRRIPVFHLEAGNRCFNDQTPEELNRRLVDHMSDMNLAYTEHARWNLLREGLRPDRVLVTGSPQREVLEYFAPRIRESNTFERLGVRPSEYVLASIHREENVDDAIVRERWIESLLTTSRRMSVGLLMLVHPRLAPDLLTREFESHVRLLPSLGFIDYLSLASHALCVVSDSGTLTEESAIVGFPGVMLRQWHERPEGMDVGVVGMASPSSLENAIRRAVSLRREAGVPIVDAYSVRDVSRRVANIVSSYAESLRGDLNRAV